MAEEKRGGTRGPSLRRSRSERLLGGVAGGIAAYFDIDPVLVRLAFVVLAIAGGSGILIYLLAWLIVPEEQGDAIASRSGVDGDTARLLIGGALIAIGGVVLAEQIIPSFTRYFIPIALITGGAIVIMGAKR